MEEWGEQYVICNWNEGALGIIIQLHSDVLRYEGEARPITVIDPNEQSLASLQENYGKYFYDVRFHLGDPSDQNVLHSGGVDKALCVIVLSREEDGENADARTMLTLLALNKIRDELIEERKQYGLIPGGSGVFERHGRLPRVLLEFRDRESATRRFKGILEGTEDWVSWLDARTMDTLLFGQAARRPGQVKLYFDLLSFTKQTEEVYRVGLPKALLEMRSEEGGPLTFRDAAIRLMERSIEGSHVLLIGMVKDGQVIANPAPDMVLEDHDDLLVVSKDPPELNQLLRNR